VRADGASPRLERRVGRPGPIARGRRDVLTLTLTKDGRLANEAEIERISKAASTASDCFVFCHGWRYDAAESRADAGRFFALLDAAFLPLGERVTPLRIALHWPSKPFADGDEVRVPRDGGLWPELERRIRNAGRPPRTGLRAAVNEAPILRDLYASEIPHSPEDEAELDILGERIAHAERRGMPLPFEALSFWVMKRRAGEVGERLGREYLAPLWRSLPTTPRLHLVGHSFGAKLVTSAVLGGARPASLTLLLGAFSAFAFAREIPRSDRSGFYHHVLAEGLVQGPIAVLRSDHDTALGTFYHRPSPPAARSGADAAPASRR